MTDGDTERTVVFESAAARRGALLRASALAVSLFLVAAAVYTFVPVADPAWVRTHVAALGHLAPLGFVALQTAQVILAPVLGQLLGGVGGYLFGTARGTVTGCLYLSSRT